LRSWSGGGDAAGILGGDIAEGGLADPSLSLSMSSCVADVVSAPMAVIPSSVWGAADGSSGLAASAVKENRKRFILRQRKRG
jgi:hypothetical protein